MRGVEQIKEINENPHGRPTEEHFGTRFVGEDPHEPKTETPEPPDHIVAFAGHLTNLSLLDAAFGFGLADEPGELEEMAVVATMLDKHGVKHPANYADAKALAVKLMERDATPNDRIQHGIDQPPFINFWADLNARRERAGLPEALYREAKTIFAGGETPVGAMTFIGKQWDGLRAVPATPVKVLGGPRPAYLGQYRQTTETRGVVWHTLKKGGEPTIFRIPEEAITEAEKVRNYRVTHHGFKS